MKKGVKYLIAAVIAVVVVGIYYYITLPAINIHSPGFWSFIFFAVVAAMAAYVLWALKKEYDFKDKNLASIDIKNVKGLKIWIGVLLALVIVFAAGNILSSPIVNAKKYQSLMTAQTREFTEDIEEVNYNTIPLLDRSSATLLGDRKMGSLVDMVSQFEVADDYTQINYKDKPVRVTPLVYASTIKWFTNQSEGIPAYMLIDMATQETECVKLEEGIRYSKSELFNRNIYRHLRFNYPTYIFDDQIFFEIDDNGVPYWVCPVKKYNIGLFGGITVGSAVLCNAITGECTEYAVEDVPQWVDKVYSAERLVELYNYTGLYVNGYFNSILGQKGCLKSTNGYNYIALDDDVWVYTGVTSVNGDQSNVGFILMNQRTMETRFYRVEGAIEDSAMSSAEGQVQNLGYTASFPLLLNIADEPTYFMALKDGSGLVKKYAMVNVEKYQWVAIGDTVGECEENYNELLSTNGIVSSHVPDAEKVSGRIEAIAPVVIEGTTHYYIYLENQDAVYDVDISDTSLLTVIKYQPGDMISLEYQLGAAMNTVTAIQ